MSLGQQLMGGLGTAASIYGGMGGFSKGGFGSFGQAGGQVGGLASLASGGQIQGGGFETHQDIKDPRVRASSNHFIARPAAQSMGIPLPKTGEFEDEELEIKILEKKPSLGPAEQERLKILKTKKSVSTTKGKKTDIKFTLPVETTEKKSGVLDKIKSALNIGGDEASMWDETQEWIDPSDVEQETEEEDNKHFISQIDVGDLKS